MNYNRLNIPSRHEKQLDEMSSPYSTMAPGSVSAVMRDNAMSWEDIDKLISRWDCEPLGPRLFVVRILRTKSSGEHGTQVWIPDDTAQLSNDVAVIAAGCDATIRYRGEDYLPQPGDTLTIAQWSGTNIKRWWAGSKEVMCINSDDFLALVETAETRKEKENINATR